MVSVAELTSQSLCSLLRSIICASSAEHFADDLEVSLEADMGEAFNVELEDDSAREACPVLANLHYC